MTSMNTTVTAPVVAVSSHVGTIDEDAQVLTTAGVGERLARQAHELTFAVPMLAVLAAVLRNYLHPQAEAEEGFTVAEWVIGTAIVVALAIAVGAIITAKITQKANGIDLG